MIAVLYISMLNVIVEMHCCGETECHGGIDSRVEYELRVPLCMVRLIEVLNDLVVESVRQL